MARKTHTTFIQKLKLNYDQHETEIRLTNGSAGLSMGIENVTTAVAASTNLTPAEARSLAAELIARSDEIEEKPEAHELRESDGNLVRHAHRELTILGEEPESIGMYLETIRTFSKFGHSGGSASVAIPTLNELLSFRNLRPLTDNPDEWHHVADEQAGRPDLWQNIRNSEAFSNDGGKTYRLNSEATWEGEDDEREFIPGPLHTSQATTE